MTPPRDHEMAEVQPLTSTDSAVNGSWTSGDDGMSRFYEEVSFIQDSLAEFTSSIRGIAELHARALTSADVDTSQEASALLDDLVAGTRQRSNDIKERIQSLSVFQVSLPRDMQIRNTQFNFLRSRFLDAIQSYQQVERDYRVKYKQRVERQFRIVKPDATLVEVDAVVNDAYGGSDQIQIFQQALMNSTRYGETRAAYREVQDRQQDIQRIERTLEELARMFQDMSTLAEQQEEPLDAINVTTEYINDDTEAGLRHTKQAAVHVHNVRRMRWICFGIVLLICAALAISLGLVFGGHR